MTTYLIGQLIEVEPIEVQKKGSRNVEMRVELTVQFDGINEGGYIKRSTETVSFTDEDAMDVYDRFEPLRDKYVAVPYRTISTPKGTYTFPDTSLPIFDFDKPIFDFSPFRRTKSTTEPKKQ